jgi:5'-nucleotidase
MTRRTLTLAAAAVVVVLIPVSPAVAQDSDSTKPLRILVANDDGYQAPGLLALVDSLVTIGNLFVAAPLEQQSGTGHGISFRDPIRVLELGNQYGIEWYAIDATPATVVRVALSALMDSLPDLVVSGVNTGDNVGVSAWVSGTVAAAREGALHGIPAIAASVGVGNLQDYAVAAGYVKRLIVQLRAQGQLEPGLLLNVNVPAGGDSVIKGTRVVGMSLMTGTQRYDERYSPRGVHYFWDVWSPPPDDSLATTDLHAFARGYVTITPLTLDQTDGERLRSLRSLVERN